MQRDDGGSVYLRLSTRSLPQPERTLTTEQQADIVSGGYWYAPPEDGADVAIVAMGAVTPEAISAHESVVRDFAGAGLLVLTGTALGTWVHPAFHGLAAFVGAGLTFAGLTDRCGMAMLLAKMPWNQRTGVQCAGNSCSV